MHAGGGGGHNLQDDLGCIGFSFNQKYRNRLVSRRCPPRPPLPPPRGNRAVAPIITSRPTNQPCTRLSFFSFCCCFVWIFSFFCVFPSVHSPPHSNKQVASLQEHLVRGGTVSETKVIAGQPHNFVLRGGDAQVSSPWPSPPRHPFSSLHMLL